MRAEITWNGTAKSYRIGTEEFKQNRTRRDDWPVKMIEYLESTRGFSVMRLEDVKRKPEIEHRKSGPGNSLNVADTGVSLSDDSEKSSRRRRNRP